MYSRAIHPQTWEQEVPILILPIVTRCLIPRVPLACEAHLEKYSLTLLLPALPHLPLNPSTKSYQHPDSTPPPESRPVYLGSLHQQPLLLCPVQGRAFFLLDFSTPDLRQPQALPHKRRLHSHR